MDLKGLITLIDRPKIFIYSSLGAKRWLGSKISIHDQRLIILTVMITLSGFHCDCFEHISTVSEYQDFLVHFLLTLSFFPFFMLISLKNIPEFKISLLPSSDNDDNYVEKQNEERSKNCSSTFSYQQPQPFVHRSKEHLRN